MSLALGPAANPSDPRVAAAASTSPEALPSTPEAAPLASSPAWTLETRSFELPFHPQQALLSGLPAAAARAPSFADQVRGTTPQKQDLQFAQLSQAVYDPSVKQVGNWTRLDDTQLRAKGIEPAQLEDPKSGFHAGLYQDGSGHVVLAFAGSNDIKDWLNNAQQGLGFNSAQYSRAEDVARLAKAAYGDDLAITGHSLGGGLAATASLASGAPAVTFNASGVSDDTMRGLGLDPSATRSAAANDGQIRRYTVGGEILTTIQQHSPLPDGVGHPIGLPDPHPRSFWEKLNPIGDIQHSTDLHMIGSVLDAMKKVAPWN